MDTRILVFVSGVEMWKVTPSKSEMTWSIEAGVALAVPGVSVAASGDGSCGAYLLKRSVRIDFRRRLWYSRRSYGDGGHS